MTVDTETETVGPALFDGGFDDLLEVFGGEDLIVVVVVGGVVGSGSGVGGAGGLAIVAPRTDVVKTGGTEESTTVTLAEYSPASLGVPAI